MKLKKPTPFFNHEYQKWFWEYLSCLGIDDNGRDTVGFYIEHDNLRIEYNRYRKKLWIYWEIESLLSTVFNLNPIESKKMIKDIFERFYNVEVDTVFTGGLPLPSGQLYYAPYIPIVERIFFNDES
jgi:hypothetical protein